MAYMRFGAHKVQLTSESPDTFPCHYMASTPLQLFYMKHNMQLALQITSRAIMSTPSKDNTRFNSGIVDTSIGQKPRLKIKIISPANFKFSLAVKIATSALHKVYAHRVLHLSRNKRITLL